MLTQAKAISIAKRQVKLLQRKLIQAAKGKCVNDDDIDGCIFIDDIANHISIYNLIIKNKLKEAFNSLCDLDTSARELFNNKLYDYLESIDEVRVKPQKTCNKCSGAGCESERSWPPKGIVRG